MRQNNKKKNTFVAENAGGSHFFCNLHPISEKASIGEMLEWLKRGSQRLIGCFIQCYLCS